MRNVYIAMESIGALIILILLYANIFEIKLRSKKQKVFTNLLVLNFIVVVADAISWMSLNWSKIPWLFTILVSVAYILPLLIQATFSNYVFAHISEKLKINKLPFKIILIYSISVGIITTVLCLTGKIFTITDGIWQPGPAERLYYLLYIIPMVYISVLIIVNGKKLGLHDLIAALLFFFFPIVSIIVSISPIKINLSVPLLGIDVLVIYILLQTDNENKLIYQSNNDELTGLCNRRAYEDDIMNYPDVPPESDFVYASIDINGLKQINDTFGHAAGDELIRGAAFCLKRTFGKYGKVYRTGGDEFISMFFADENHLCLLIEDLKNLTVEWQGKIVSSLSVSVGYASKREFSSETVEEMSKIADKRMYEDKAKYYASKGVDRRGQNEAHKVLCSLYTKILKINVTDDNYSIISMDAEEQSKENGFSDKISEWLECFGKSGCVHPEDLEEYLTKTKLEYIRNHFMSGKKSLTIMYRRKYSDGFKRVIMEMIPTKDYFDENQTMFLYVKNIDI